MLLLISGIGFYLSGAALILGVLWIREGAIDSDAMGIALLWPFLMILLVGVVVYEGASLVLQAVKRRAQ
jgi:hypothetical protein